MDERPRSGTGDAVVRSLGGRADGTFFVAPIVSTPPPGAIRRDASAWVRIRSRGARVHLALEWLDVPGSGTRDPGVAAPPRVPAGRS